MIFIFLDIFFIGLILTKYFGNLPTYFTIYTFAKPSFAFLSGVSFDYIMLPQELVSIKFSLKQYFPNSSMDNKNVQSKKWRTPKKTRPGQRKIETLLRTTLCHLLFIPSRTKVHQPTEEKGRRQKLKQLLQ